MKLVSKLQTINFKNCKILLKRYDGTTKTQSILYDNKVYMLKFQEKKRAKVLKTELEYKTQNMFKEMIRIANKVLKKEKEQTNSWIKKDIDDDWER